MIILLKLCVIEHKNLLLRQNDIIFIALIGNVMKKSNVMQY